MNLKMLYYNNTLLYLSAIENRFSLVESLILKGYPKNLNEIPYKIRKTINIEEQNKILISYNNAFNTVLKQLIENAKHNQLIKIFLQNQLSQNPKSASKLIKHHTGDCFFYNNLEAFHIFVDLLGKENTLDNQSLQWYCYQILRGNSSDSSKKKLLSFLDTHKIDWKHADFCFERCINFSIQPKYIDYIYQKRKQALGSESSLILRKNIISSMGSAFIQEINTNKNINNPILEYLANKPEFTKKHPYEGFLWILRKALLVYSKTYQNIQYLEDYLINLYIKHPDSIEYLYKNKKKVSQLKETIDKLYLKHKLTESLRVKPSLVKKLKI
jgi:hypothetical protein